jgi:hypothetical protein
VQDSGLRLILEKRRKHAGIAVQAVVADGGFIGLQRWL